MKDSADSRPAKVPPTGASAHATPGDGEWQGSKHSDGAHSEASGIRLTPREREVLSLLCEGMSNKAIGRRLDIAVATVKVHVSNILRALDVSTRLEAVLLARCWDLVAQPSAGGPHTRPIPRRIPR